MAGSAGVPPAEPRLRAAYPPLALSHKGRGDFAVPAFEGMTGYKKERIR